MTPPLEMAYRQLGRTSLRTSVVGFGSSPLGNVFSATDPTESIAAVHLAIDRGINFFDVSPYYGATLAETRLGEALKGRRERIVLATKCGRYGPDQFDFSAARVTSSIEESLRRLQTDSIDLFQVHDVEFGDVQQIVEETVPAMRVLQEQGKARYVGITGYSLPPLLDIAQQVPVDSILTYCRHNLLINDIDQRLLPFAKEHEIGVINASALHMGLLTMAPVPPWHPAPEPVRQAAKAVMEFCRKQGLDGSEVALRFCFDQPEIASTLVGFATRDQVNAALQARERASDEVLLGEIRELVGPAFNYVWPSGRAENQG